MDKKIITNTDTGLLKIIAFAAMVIDHAGYLFFPTEIIFRIIGRIAFPLFAYCLVVGFFRTKNLKKYFVRLWIFSAVSQLPYTLCFYPDDLRGGIFEISLNIGFTLLIGLWALYGLSKKKYLQLFAAILLSLVPNFEYGIYGVLAIVIMGFFIDGKRSFFGACTGLFLASPLFGMFSEISAPIQGYAALAVIPVLIKTDSKIELPRAFTYGFYPAHLLILAFIDYLLK